MLPQKTITHLNKLQEKKHRTEFQEFIVEGAKGVGEALTEDAEVVLIIIEGNRRDEKEFAALIKTAEQKNVPVEFCARGDIGDIKTTDTFPGVLAVIARPDIGLEHIVNDYPIICLDGVKDPGNIGTIIRTADWFGVPNLLLSEDCVDPYNPKVVRSTMGSLFRVQLFESQHLPTTLTTLKEKHGYELVALEMQGEPIEKLRPSKKTVYLFGSESHGTRPSLESLISKRYTIQGAPPHLNIGGGGKGRAESLNVAVASGILMSHLQ